MLLMVLLPTGEELKKPLLGSREKNYILVETLDACAKVKKPVKSDRKLWKQKALTAGVAGKMEKI